MELLTAGAARVRDDEDFAWIVAGKQDGPWQGERTIFTGSRQLQRWKLLPTPIGLHRYVRSVSVSEAAGFERVLRVLSRSKILSRCCFEGEEGSRIQVCGIYTGNEQRRKEPYFIVNII
jgi:hypothetical protein